MWVRKVTEGPVIRYDEGRRLQEMADDLRSCKDTLRAMNKLEEIDTCRSMVKIVERLPQPLQSRWRRLVVKSLKTTNRYPSLAEFVCFVSEAAREVTDPVFGVSENKVRRPERGRGASFGVQGDESQQGPGRWGRGSDSKVKDDKIKHDDCRLCRGGHDLSACSRFKAMSPGEKLSFVWGKRLCFCCFDGRHVARELWRTEAAPNPGANSHRVESHTHACSSPRQGQTKLALPIVPVKVRAKGQTAYHYKYALLDSGSTKTFCSKSLVDKLDVKGEPANLSLTTVNSSESADLDLVALEVVAAKGGAGRPNVIQLPKVYALPNQPTFEHCIASDSDFRKWSHLKDLRLPQIDKSGLAWGWSLNGPVGSEPFVEEPAFSNYVHADERLNAQVEQFWKLETNEALANSLPQFSVDDKKAVNIWEQSIELVNGHYHMDIPFKSKNPNLPDNRVIAEKRHRSLTRRLLRDPDLHVKYKAAFDGTSLNKEVLQGPDFTNNLVGVLLRFRKAPVAVMGDVPSGAGVSEGSGCPAVSLVEECCSKRFQTFVANRLSVIHDGSIPNQWRKVGTKENPADDVSRGLSGFEMVSSDRWKRGPEFLWQEECTWPTNPAVPEIASDDKELKYHSRRAM
ncbi:uncharacterized protein [Montipora capricornis]|uniref:uncharacterized protein n=1 Tax=Montipora capricornis TaxID=246305 RepID=UPI0035F1471D